MNQDTTQSSQSPDLSVIERDLRRLIWATGGWAGLHAVGGVLVVASGALFQVPGTTLRLAVLLVMVAWAVAAVACWQFRRSFRTRIGFVGAGASIVAGVGTGAIGMALGDLGGMADGIAHLALGVGLARAVSQARPFLDST